VSAYAGQTAGYFRSVVILQYLLTCSSVVTKQISNLTEKGNILMYVKMHWLLNSESEASETLQGGENGGREDKKQQLGWFKALGVVAFFFCFASCCFL